MERGNEKAKVASAGFSGLWKVYSQPLHKLSFLIELYLRSLVLPINHFEIFDTEKLLISAYVLVGQKMFFSSVQLLSRVQLFATP